MEPEQADRDRDSGVSFNSKRSALDKTVPQVTPPLGYKANCTPPLEEPTNSSYGYLVASMWPFYGSDSYSMSRAEYIRMYHSGKIRPLDSVSETEPLQIKKKRSIWSLRRE